MDILSLYPQNDNSSHKRRYAYPVRPLAERFWEKVAIGTPDECWEWQASLSPKGYGQFKIGGRQQNKNMLAHRVAYLLSGGVIPDEMQLDHKCRNRRCVNPAHLEPVTSRENTLRGDTIPAHFATVTCCINGHELTQENLYPCKTQRRCKACTAKRNRERMQRKRAQAKVEGKKIPSDQ